MGEGLLLITVKTTADIIDKILSCLLPHLVFMGRGRQEGHCGTVRGGLCGPSSATLGTSLSASSFHRREGG